MTDYNANTSKSTDYNANTSKSAAENKVCPICKKLLIKQSDGSFYCECGYSEILTTESYSSDEIRQIFANIDSNGNNPTAEPLKTNNAPGLYGWICPKCGAVMSPFMDFCPNCTHHNWKITYSTSSTSPTHMYESKQSTFDANKFIGGRKDKLGYE